MTGGVDGLEAIQGCGHDPAGVVIVQHHQQVAGSGYGHEQSRDVEVSALGVLLFSLIPASAAGERRLWSLEEGTPP